MEQKILELFEYRKLPFLLSFLGTRKADKLLRNLVSIQEAIYNLDLYLESTWNLDKEILKEKWKLIYEALKRCDISSSKAKKMTTDIRRYQRHEEQLRENLAPTALDIEYYYHYKSCDVRLMREIIEMFCPAMDSRYAVEKWRYFDLITEVNDDVEDVYEDMETINGNHFLVWLGLKDQDSKYKVKHLSFIEYCNEQSKNLCSHKSDDSDTSKIVKWTNDVHRETKHLILERLEDQKLSVQNLMRNTLLLSLIKNNSINVW